MNKKDIDKFTLKTEFIFLIIIGSKNVMGILLNDLKSKETDREKYTLTKISESSSKKSLELMKKLNNVEDDNLLNSTTQKPVLIDEGVEYAHCYTYADGSYQSDSYILQKINDNDNHYVLSFPKFPLSDDEIPENIVDEWFKTNLGKIIRKHTKIITIAGSNADTLVCAINLL